MLPEPGYQQLRVRRRKLRMEGVTPATYGERRCQALGLVKVWMP